LNASTEGEIDTAFTELSQQRIAALLVGTDVLFITRRDQIVALANGLRVATMYNAREYVVAGGLISYAPSLTEVYRQAGIYDERSDPASTIGWQSRGVQRARIRFDWCVT
jgi:putative ABC transport system substrate-binding protein